MDAGCWMWMQDDGCGCGCACACACLSHRHPAIQLLLSCASHYARKRKTFNYLNYATRTMPQKLQAVAYATKSISCRLLLFLFLHLLLLLLWPMLPLQQCFQHCRSSADTMLQNCRKLNACRHRPILI